MAEPFEARILIVPPDGIGLIADVSYKTIKHIYSGPFYVTTIIILGKLAKVLGIPLES